MRRIAERRISRGARGELPVYPCELLEDESIHAIVQTVEDGEVSFARNRCQQSADFFRPNARVAAREIVDTLAVLRAANLQEPRTGSDLAIIVPALARLETEPARRTCTMNSKTSGVGRGSRRRT